MNNNEKIGTVCKQCKQRPVDKKAIAKDMCLSCENDNFEKEISEMTLELKRTKTEELL